MAFIRRVSFLSAKPLRWLGGGFVSHQLVHPELAMMYAGLPVLLRLLLLFERMVICKTGSSYSSITRPIHTEGLLALRGQIKEMKGNHPGMNAAKSGMKKAIDPKDQWPCKAT